MNKQNNPIFIILSPDVVENFDVERLNQLTRELGRSLEGQPEYIHSISYGGREDLPKGTKTPELIFAQQCIITLIPIVTPWIIDKIDKFVKASVTAGTRITARLQMGNREVQVTPKTTSSEMLKIKQQVKAIEELSPGKRYALVIGNSEYLDEHLAELESPTFDAERLAEVFSDPSISAFDQVETLINKDNDVIEKSSERFFSNRNRDDLLLLYFSGHGIRNEVGQLFLAARNTMRDLIRSTGISAGFIKEIMDASFSQRQILILDCCFGGAMLEGAKSEQFVGQSVNSRLAFQTSGFGRIIITASESMQYAFDGQSVHGRTENSAFTHHLIEGLRSGRADADNDGLIAIDELYQYAYRKVIPRQTPSMSAATQTGRLYIALNPNPTIHPAKLPEDLRVAMQSVNRVHRMGAVSELALILKTGGPSMVIAAENALRQMASDDSRAVGEAAQETLNEHLGLLSTKSQQQPAHIEAPLAPPPAMKPKPAPDSVSVTTPELGDENLGIVEEPVIVPPVDDTGRREKEDIPDVAQKWSWGAFWLTFIWGIKHKSKRTWLFLIPFPPLLTQIVVGVYCGLKGSRWAWQNLQWENEAEYVRDQSNWTIWGFVLGWLVWLSVIYIYMNLCTLFL